MIHMRKTTTTKMDCHDCDAICCKNLAMEIGKPENSEEIEDLKWQLHFDTVQVYVRNRKWYQLVQGKCIYLNDDNRCTQYHKRPKVCRRHNPPSCELFGDFFDEMISTPPELEKYLEKKSRKKSKKTSSGRKVSCKH